MPTGPATPRGPATSSVRVRSIDVRVDGRPQRVDVVVDLLDPLEGDLGLVLLAVEQAEVFLLAVEVQSTDRLAVVVIEQDPEVRLGVAVGDPIQWHLGGDDRPDDVVGLELLLGRLDATVGVLGLAVTVALDVGTGGVGDRDRGADGRALPLQRGLESFVHAVIDVLGGRLARDTEEEFAHLRRQRSFVDAGREQTHEVLVRFGEFARNLGLHRRDVLQFLGRDEDGLEVERGLGELLQFRQRVRVDVKKVQAQERLLVHHIGLVEVGVEVPVLAVGEDADPGIRDVEIAYELPRILERERGADLLGLDEHLDHAVTHDRVVDLLALLRADVADELRHHLRRVEHVVPEDSADERHDDRVLRRFLGLQCLPVLRDLRREIGQCILERHDASPFLSPGTLVGPVPAVLPTVRPDVHHCLCRCLPGRGRDRRSPRSPLRPVPTPRRLKGKDRSSGTRWWRHGRGHPSGTDRGDRDQTPVERGDHLPADHLEPGDPAVHPGRRGGPDGPVGGGRHRLTAVLRWPAGPRVGPRPAGHPQGARGRGHHSVGVRWGVEAQAGGRGAER
ncbi:hypothetical protein SDC9_89143 [bioreactor metagenome]|uniref:Uncharacterized protein n=1 Tax=bioreactor metagenome TaxID=1076179 RepID=A0A644ZQ12_9ZZZZ